MVLEFWLCDQKCHFFGLKDGHFWQKCLFSDHKKWHFWWQNRNSKTTFIVQTLPKYGPYDFYLVNLSLLCAILANLGGKCWQESKILQSARMLCQLRGKSTTAMTYLATCQFTETRDEGIFKNCRQHYICICLATVADFCFYKHSICIFGFNISQLFLLHSYPPQIIDISRAICEHVSIWLSTSWICVRISFVFPRFFYTIFFPRILCCEKWSSVWYDDIWQPCPQLHCMISRCVIAAISIDVLYTSKVPLYTLSAPV